MSNRPQNFLIVGAQRTGSSALAEMINTHPQIAVGWEWTERAPWLLKLKRMQSYLEGDFSTLNSKARAQIEASIGSDTRWLGFRRLFGASSYWIIHPGFSAKLAADRFGAHMRWLRSTPNVRVVHIARNNHLSWLKSKYVAKASGSFVGRSHPKDMRIHIPLRNAVARVEAKIWLDNELSKLRKTNKYIRINYEDFQTELSTIAAEVAAFLDCDPAAINPGSTVIRKQSDRPDSDYISNYQQLQEAIAQIDRA